MDRRTGRRSVVALDGGGVLIDDAALGTMTEVSSVGDIVQTVPAPVLEPRSIMGGQEAIHGIDPVTHTLTEMLAIDFSESGYAFNALGGSPQRQGAAQMCMEPPFSIRWKAIEAGATFKHAFEGEAWTNVNEGRQVKINRQSRHPQRI